MSGPSTCAKAQPRQYLYEHFSTLQVLTGAFRALLCLLRQEINACSDLSKHAGHQKYWLIALTKQAGPNPSIPNLQCMHVQCVQSLLHPSLRQREHAH